MVTTWVDESGGTGGTELDAANLNADTAADTTEAATNDTLGAGSTYINNLNRIRYQLGQIYGGAWNAAAQMIPISQKGANNGVASVDQYGHTLQHDIADSTESQANDTLAANSGIVSNLNRIRYQLGMIYGGAWNAAVQMIPLSQKGAASGVSSLNASGYVVQSLANGIRQVVTYYPTSDITVDSSHQSVPSSTYSNWGHLADIPITTKSGSSIAVILSGTPWNFYTGGGNWWRQAVALDGGNVSQVCGELTITAANQAYQASMSGIAVWSGVSAGAHTVNLLGASGGPGGVNPAGGFKGANNGSTDSMLNIIVVEFA